MAQKLVSHSEGQPAETSEEAKQERESVKKETPKSYKLLCIKKSWAIESS
jgi:hypothetical protein